MNRLISVIVPVYKVEKYIARCLDSIISQTYKNLEIIIVDDGTPDGSGRICDEYALKDSRIRVIHQENGGVSSARNAGLDIANGDFVIFLDSDDYIESDMYQSLVDIITKENADIAICGDYNETEQGVFERYVKDDIYCVFSQQEQIINLLSNKYYRCSCCDKLFRKEIIKDIRFDTSIKHNEDLLFLYQVMKNSDKAVYTSKPYYYYCTNEGSATNSLFNDSMLGIIDVSDYILEDIKKNFPALIAIEKKQFIRNNISTAMSMVYSAYENKQAYRRIQKNIRHYLWSYLCSDASIGYKFSAILISINRKIFKKYVMRRYKIN